MPGLIPDNEDNKLMPVLIPDDKDSNNRPALITNVKDKSIANIFCFRAFADKKTSVVYNGCTGDIPFMFLDRHVCFLSCIIIKPMPSLPHQYLDWI
jgi:hypothetical protein